ncbi:MAG: hypothetical protein A2144_00640 [Chloroflexi bacterium RBG_16_50_9]|nr:MAG: hypothetical protein A2144_00640 [Chloroflexi bacterium RBG_16_50_9]
MRYAVAVPEITSNTKDNLDKILSMMSEASISGADIVLFPETVLTGLNICDDYDIDRQLAYPLESVPVQAIIDNAAKCRMWTAFGFLELSDTTIFDSAVLVDANGKIVLHQRRMSPGWRAKNANPLQYGSGASLSTAITPWGKTAILICGDLFETAFPQAVDAKFDLLLFPFDRCFSRQVTEPQKQWNNVEWIDYSARIKQISALTLMSNYILTFPP